MKLYFPSLSAALAHIAGEPVIERGARKELKAWMELHERRVEADDSFDTSDGDLHHFLA